MQALHYDVRRGPHSVGSHVRDAAAYVCWAFGRAYYNRDMKNVLEQVAPHLLTVACYDREVLNYNTENFLFPRIDILLNSDILFYSLWHDDESMSLMLRLIAEEQRQLLSRKM